MAKVNIQQPKGLFARLLFIFAGLGIAVTLSFVLSYHFFSEQPLRITAQKNIKRYVRYIIKDIGVPPDIKKADQLSKELGLLVGIFKDDFKYRSAPEIPGPKAFKGKKKLRRKFKSDEGFQRKRFIQVKRNGYFYVIGYDNANLEKPFLPFFIAIALSLLFMVFSYHLVQRMFRPLQHIKEAAQEYASGNFDYKLQPSHKMKKADGVLEDLSSSVQEMAIKIESMLDSKRELLLAIAHELRTPLTRAKLHLEFLEDGEHKQKLEDEINEMSILVTNLLESEKIKSGHAPLSLENTDMGELVDSVIRTYFAGETQISVAAKAQVNLKVDRNLYELIVKNLLSNACRHGAGKPVTVELTDQYLAVSDLGEGISPSEIEKITEAFYRVDESRERGTGGVGLGLYLSLQIIRAHDHKLEISSGEQTEFKILFKR